MRLLRVCAELRFFGVDEDTFNSLFRRSLAVRYKATFLDRDYILSKIQQPEERGIFPKDPTLKDFLRSSPACLVTLRALWQYARDHSAADCRKCLDEYVVGGKDEGLTELYVRQACGLKHISKPEDPSHAVATSKPEDQPPTVSEEVLAALRKQRDEIVGWMIQVKKDFCTRGQLRSVKGKHAWTAFSRQDVDDLLDALATQKLMHKSSLTLPKLGLTDVFSPKICATKSMMEIINMKHDESAAFPEAYDCQSLRRHMLSHKGRLANNEVLQQSHRTKAKELKKGKGGGAGVPTKEQRVLQDDQEALVQTMCKQEQALFTEVQNYLEDGVGVEQHEMVVQRTYSYKLETRCRRSVNGSGAQSFSKVFRNIVCKNMRDFDFHASMFTVVVQLVDKLDASFNDVLPSLKSWRAIADGRQAVCEDILQCSPVRGKALLLQVANGQAVSSADDVCEKGQKFLEELSKESRCLRWLARSQCPELYEKVKDGTHGFKQSSWPEATVFSYWWYSAEDYCLSSMLELFVDLDVPRNHISLHFDGLLLSDDLVQAVEQKHDGKSFADIAQTQIFERTGFRIIIKEKHFKSLVEQLSDLENTSLHLEAVDEALLTLLSEPCNCIPFAYACVTGEWLFVAELLQNVNQANTRAKERGYRCYKDWSDCNQRFLKPCLTLPSTPNTCFLLHADVGGAPRCFGAKVLADSQLQIFHERKACILPILSMEEILAQTCETFSVVFFSVQTVKPEMTASEAELLDLVAGGNSNHCLFTDRCGGGDSGDADVQVGQHLRDLLEQEVKDATRRLEQQKGQSFGSQVCPLCPWRRFEKRSYLFTHITKHHSVGKRFVASGTKQLRIIAAMYDDDAARQASHGNYISRSAELLRSHVRPGVSSKKNVIDKDIRLCLTTKGPSFMSMQKIKQAKHLRRVGNVYYDRSFANDFMCNAVASRASFRQIAAYFTSSTARHQGALCSMLPEASHSFWCNVLEDLTQSPQIKARLQDLLQECEAHTEFEYLSIDATVKCMMKIIGQAHFNSSQDCRDAAAIPDSAAAYKLLTVRGRTNAVVGLCGIRSEGSREIASGLSSMLTLSQRAQVVHMASDSPSVELFATLKNTFPNLQSLGLDAMHIVMVYEQNHSNKRTKGSRWLATVMNKFRNVDVECPAATWGPMYTGQQQIHYTAEEKRLSALVSNASMPEAEARGILQQLDPDSPWRTESQFLEAMAAICTLFQDELTKTTFSGPTLHRLLINLTSPVKIQWLFNDTRYRHACAPSQTPLLPSGTTSNESLHHELNSWFHEIDAWRRLCMFSLLS